ncbi:MAG: hypothetical protein ACRD0A_18315 [Acidimicrobiales bacterium]
MLTETNEGAAGGVGGSVVTNEVVEDSPFPAVDAEFTGTRGDDAIVGFGRSLLVGSQLFMLLALGPVDDRSDVEAVFDRFVDGFESAAAATPAS